jgi:hypothetical protein
MSTMQIFEYTYDKYSVGRICTEIIFPKRAHVAAAAAPTTMCVCVKVLRIQNSISVNVNLKSGNLQGRDRLGDLILIQRIILKRAL